MNFGGRFPKVPGNMSPWVQVPLVTQIVQVALISLMVQMMIADKIVQIAKIAQVSHFLHVTLIVQMMQVACMMQMAQVMLVWAKKLKCYGSEGSLKEIFKLDKHLSGVI